MSLINLQSFKIFLLLEEVNSGKERDKSDMYKRISYNLAEIFGLYGFFFSQQPGYFDKANWKTLMKQITVPKTPKERWEKIIALVNFLQGKVGQMSPTKRGDFGFINSYSYPEETKPLVDAAGFLKSASDIILKTFTEEEVEEAMTDMEDMLVGNPSKGIEGMKIITINPPVATKAQNQSESLSIMERRSNRPVDTSLSDIIQLLDQMLTKLLNVESSVDVLQNAYPEADARIQAFKAAKIDINKQKISKAIEEDIPALQKAGAKQMEGYLKRVQNLDKEIDGLWSDYETLKKSIMDKYQPISSSLEYIESAEDSIDKIRQGIVNQANANALDVQTSNMVAGQVEYTGSASRDASQPKSEKSRATIKAKQEKYLEDIRQYLQGKVNQGR